MDKKHLIRGNIVAVVVLLLASVSNIVGYAEIGVAHHQTTANTIMAKASWSADVNDDGNVELRGWILYTLEKGIAGRRIKITGAWGTDDGNLSGGFAIKNFIFIKLRGVSQGLFTGDISGENYGAKFIGTLYNDWEVGYWKIAIPAKIKVQVVHIPFN